MQRHHEETESVVAGELLADWPHSLTRFAKIMPRDYKRVLEASLRAERDGIDLLDTIMEGTRG